MAQGLKPDQLIRPVVSGRQINELIQLLDNGESAPTSQGMWVIYLPYHKQLMQDSLWVMLRFCS